jgi:hypothetical protein
MMGFIDYSTMFVDDVCVHVCIYVCAWMCVCVHLCGASMLVARIHSFKSQSSKLDSLRFSIQRAYMEEERRDEDPSPDRGTVVFLLPGT